MAVSKVPEALPPGGRARPVQGPLARLARNDTQRDHVLERIESHFGRAWGTPLARLRIPPLGCGGRLGSEPLARRGAQVVGVATFARGADTDQHR